jgi:hypothetical protein
MDQNLLERIKELTEVPPWSLSMLAGNMELLLGADDYEDAQVDAAFNAAFMELVDKAPLQDLSDLLAAETILDLMYTAKLRSSRTYEVLRGKARCFIERFPQLLEMGWVHSAGCISDLMEEIRAQGASKPLTMH